MVEVCFICKGHNLAKTIFFFDICTQTERKTGEKRKLQGYELKQIVGIKLPFPDQAQLTLSQLPPPFFVKDTGRFIYMPCLM